MLHMTFFMFGLPKASSGLALKTKHDSKSGITNSLKTRWFWCLIQGQAFHAKHYDSLSWCLFLWSRPSFDEATFAWKGHLTWDSVSTSSRAYQVQDKVVPSLWGQVRLLSWIIHLHRKSTLYPVRWSYWNWWRKKCYN